MIILNDVNVSPISLRLSLAELRSDLTAAFTSDILAEVRLRLEVVSLSALLESQIGDLI